MTRPEKLKLKLKLVSTKGDHDPEDEYNSLDNPVLGRKKRSEKYSKHLIDVAASCRQNDILEEHFRDGKYKGQPSSRKALGYSNEDFGGEDHEYSEGFEEEEGDDLSTTESTHSTRSTHSTCSAHSNSSTKMVDEDEQLEREMEELKQNEQVALKMIHQQKVSDKQRGLHVRNQMTAWECLLDIEMRVHPLLEIVNKQQLVLSRPTVAGIAELGRQLQSLASLEMDEQELNEGGREQLTKWHQQAVASSTTSINKASLKTFNRDPWTLVDDAWAGDRERLLKRVRRSSGDDLHSRIFDDSEFHRFLLKEWASFRSSAADPTVFRSVKSDKRGTEGRVSKGRKLCFDPHPKLIGYMMPRVDKSVEWADDKIDNLIASLFK